MSQKVHWQLADGRLACRRPAARRTRRLDRVTCANCRAKMAKIARGLTILARERRERYAP